MKKVLALAMAILMMLSMFAGCAKNESAEPGVEAAPEAEKAAADTTLVMMLSQNWVNETDEQLAAAFEAETGIKVDIQAIPDDQYQSILMSKLASGEGPDVFYARCGASIANFLPDSYMLDLSNEPWVANYKDFAKDSVTYDGKIIGLNRSDVNGWSVLYNPVIFDEYNLTEPKNFEEFKAVCQTLMDAGIRPVYHNSADTWLDALWLNAVVGIVAEEDPEIYDKFNRGEAKFADYPVLEQALNELNEMVQLGYFGDTYLSDTWDGGYDAMANGDAAMILSYPAYEFEVLGMYPDSNAADWKTFVVPFCDNNIFTTSAGGVFMAVNKDSKNLDAVKQYLAFLAETENVQTFYNGHTEWCMTTFEGTNVVSESQMLKDLQENVKFMTDFQTGIKYYNEVEISKIIQELYLGTKTASEVLVAIDDYRAEMLATEN